MPPEVAEAKITRFKANRQYRCHDCSATFIYNEKDTDETRNKELFDHLWHKHRRFPLEANLLKSFEEVKEKKHRPGSKRGDYRCLTCQTKFTFEGGATDKMIEGALRNHLNTAHSGWGQSVFLYFEYTPLKAVTKRGKYKCSFEGCNITYNLSDERYTDEAIDKCLRTHLQLDHVKGEWHNPFAYFIKNPPQTRWECVFTACNGWSTTDITGVQQLDHAKTSHALRNSAWGLLFTERKGG